LLDGEVLVELREVMEDEFTGLVNRFLGDLPLQMDHLRHAVLLGSAAEVHQIAHELASSCGNLGAIRLAEWVRRIEQAGRQNVLDGVAEMLAETSAVAEDTMTLLRAQLG
jgi:HPt (histidine-containing phosphotransfer) domain-containing protein